METESKIVEHKLFVSLLGLGQQALVPSFDFLALLLNRLLVKEEKVRLL
jgi:hypothetical protein